MKNNCVDHDTFLCVGIDPTIPSVKQLYANAANKLYDFCKAVIDVTAAHCCAVKMNHAFFSALGQEQVLASLIYWVHQEYPQTPVILDAKRNDIGSSAERYAYEAFHRYGADAVTVNAYMGWDTIDPFLSYADRGVIVLCRTSNPGANWIQGASEPNSVYLRIAEHVQRLKLDNLMLVVGATHLDALARVREVAPDVCLLIPGVGAQGGNVAEVLRVARREDGLGIVVNCSRAIMQQETEPALYLEKVAQSARYWSRELAVGT